MMPQGRGEGGDGPGPYRPAKLLSARIEQKIYVIARLTSDRAPAMPPEGTAFSLSNEWGYIPGLSFENAGKVDGGVVAGSHVHYAHTHARMAVVISVRA